MLLAKKGRCDHGNRKSRCVECGGSDICDHGIIRYGCKKCHGDGICKHDKDKSTCKQCHGNKRCEHDIFRSLCITCYRNGSGGSLLCKHECRRYTCKKCKDPNGTICDHNNNRIYCHECLNEGIGGWALCIHIKRKYNCSVCWVECEHGLKAMNCNECKKYLLVNIMHTIPKENKRKRYCYNKLSNMELCDVVDELTNETILGQNHSVPPVQQEGLTKKPKLYEYITHDHTDYNEIPIFDCFNSFDFF